MVKKKFRKAKSVDSDIIDEILNSADPLFLQSIEDEIVLATLLDEQRPSASLLRPSDDVRHSG